MYNPCFSKILIPLLFFLSSCGLPSRTENEDKQYAHLNHIDFSRLPATTKTTDFFLIILVDARHLDYSSGKSLLQSLAKHNDVGHAWIYLQGAINGEHVVVEGGHSGELGVFYPKYMEGVMDNIEAGDPNPIKYLWETQKDGFFQKGSGNHSPTFAAKIDLTQQQFEGILTYMDPKHFDYSNYAMTGNQCASFVAQIAQIADLDIACEVTVPIKKSLSIWGKRYVLWTDPWYSSLKISSPDVVERTLIHCVRNGQAEYALPWYTTCKAH